MNDLKVNFNETMFPITMLTNSHVFPVNILHYIGMTFLQCKPNLKVVIIDTNHQITLFELRFIHD